MKKLILCFALIPLMVACESKETVVSKDPAELPNPNVSDSLYAEGFEPGEAEANKKADEDATETTESTETAEPEKSPAEQITALLDEFKTKMDEFRTAYQEASDSERRKVFTELYPKPQDYSGKLMDLARENPDVSNAMDALLWVARNSRGGNDMKEAIDTLLEKHSDSEKLDEIAMVLMYSRDPEAKSKLEKLIESKHDSVKAAATFAMASMLKNSSERDDSITEDDYLPLFKTVVEKYADAELGGRSLAKMAEGAIFEIEHLSIGKEAPDIEGEDLDGVAFKLSDYRGKVIMLDFWGDW